MRTRVYTPRPMKYRQWVQIKKEMKALVIIAAAVFIFCKLVEVAAWTVAKSFTA